MNKKPKPETTEQKVRRLMSAVCAEPIYLDEETLRAAAKFKLPEKYRENMNRAAERIREEVRRQGGVPPD